MQPEIRLRITVIGAAPEVTFAVQRGKNELLVPSRAIKDERTFEFTLRVGEPLPDGRPRFLGPYAQGPPEARFVYVNSGTLAGESGSCWTRRAKVPLKNVTAAMVSELLADGAKILEGQIAGTAKDGGPCCASVPLLPPGWSIVEGESYP